MTMRWVMALRPQARSKGPWVVEFALVLTMSFALLLSSYELLVRNTFIGAWLNGRRKPRGPERLERA